MLVAMYSWQLVAQNSLAEVRGVIDRFTNDSGLPVKLEMIGKEDGKDLFEVGVKDGVLHVKSSSYVGLCRGFYDFVRSHQYGMMTWNGKRCDLPAKWEDSPAYKVVTPFRDHYYFNVVTYGYSLPYWDWARWEKEIDWMALHGFDMPLALAANEAISARVWKKLGLTDKEISEYFVGPAHLPWMRMGNISGIDGPMPEEWHADQIALQHKILKRMKSLGMKPICPGFAGFIPQAMKRIHPDVKIVETSWAGDFHNWMLSPEEDLFHEIGKMFIEEWEKEFGANDYYLVDSFNEMDIPFPPKDDPSRYTLLASYGDKVYQSIKAGNKDAVWVMQGWMFGYQRNIWDYKTLEALVSKVPDDKMLLLDLAVDYNKCFWKSEVNWEFYKGFYNKPWVYSVIPNMGGKSGMTGMLSFYANGQWEALRSANKGNLTGFGMAPEGIENNEVIYELLSDAGWSDKEIDLQNWLKNYSLCRYGKYPEEMKVFWDDMQQSVYGSFTDHPRYNWQFRPGRVRKGSINANETFFKGIETLAQVAPQMKSSPLFKADFQQWAAAYLGGKMEILTRNIEDAYLYGDLEDALVYEKLFEKLMLGTDRILAGHPTSDMQQWIDFARGHGTTPQLADYYELNARRIITIWGPPIDDYSARIWSGLIRDYYLPRWLYYFEQKKNGEKFDFASWELDWVKNKKGLSPAQKSKDVIDEAIALIKEASAIAESPNYQVEILGNWSAADVKEDLTEMEWVVPAEKIKQLKGIRVRQLRGRSPLIIASVELIMDGVKVASSGVEKETSEPLYYPLSVSQEATGNNSSVIKITLRSKGNPDSSGNIELVF